MDIAEFITKHAAGWHTPIYEPKQIDSLKYDSPIRPADYLEFAHADLEKATLHGLVNAFSNAKRGIDCQVTSILNGLGLSRSGNFPEKVARIQKLGLLAPRIVGKVIRVRNLLEHEFQKPTQTEAEDAVDVATLFIEATRRVFQNHVTAFYVADEKSANKPPFKKVGNRTIFYEDKTPCWTYADCIYVERDEKQKDFGIWCVLSNKEVLDCEVLVSNPLHAELVAFLVRNYMDHEDFDNERSGREFLQLFGKVDHSLA